MKSQISAKIIADSVNLNTLDRLITFQIRVPKFLLAEINTHRSLSKNFASSRAIPAKKIREQVIKDPFIPVYWGANQKGMQAKQELTGIKLFLAKKLWLYTRYFACVAHWLGEKIGLHKQTVNRLIEPWMCADGVISGTEWLNFFALRDHEDAQPEFRMLAQRMSFEYARSMPEELKPGEWHLPFIDTETLEVQKNYNTDQETVYRSLAAISSARCARVSYLLQDGKKSNLDSDIKLCERLAGSNPKHLSPMEHPAMALDSPDRIGNFVGWKQYRKTFLDESGGDYLTKT